MSFFKNKILSIYRSCIVKYMISFTRVILFLAAILQQKKEKVFIEHQNTLTFTNLSTKTI